MLTLNPGSACDVCAEEYGAHCLPHSIPCGHVLCSSCCSTIVEKTSSRHMPVCPFCREQFTNDSIRLIRMDFTTSGWSTPRRVPPGIDAHVADFTSDLWARKTERLLQSEGSTRTRSEARRLEDKVAKIAARKCSVEEVSTLHKELQEWLMSSDAKQDEQTASLHLSAALLRAILMNHLAHSESSKNAKTVEANLKIKVDDLEVENEKLEAELRRQRTQYSQKSQECQSLRTELSRLKALATTLGPAGGESWQTSPPTSPTSTSPTPPYPSSTQSPLSRYHSSVHTRSISMSSSRPTTPSPSPARSHTPAPSLMRSQTPAPVLRSHTPAPSVRSHTPAPSARSHTPAPSVRSHTPAPSIHRSYTPAPSQLRTQTPAPPIPPKPRRLSTPSPPKMMRSTSDEKYDQHERWIPPPDPDFGPPSSKASKYASRPPSRASYSISSVAARFRDTRSPSPA